MKRFYLVAALAATAGPYINDVYIWDYAGQFSMYRVITNTPSKMPKIVKITVSEVSSTGYRVTAQIEASRGISKVLMPTWTEGPASPSTWPDQRNVLYESPGSDRTFPPQISLRPAL